MSLLSRFRLILAALGLVFLAACDTAEERAEGHYQRGLTLLEAGEESKALLEFKNAIQLNERAIGPRIEFAKIRTKQGELKGAIGNYLKVIEVDEEHLESRIAVSTLLLQWDRDTDRSSEHINIADELAPDNLEVRGLVAALAQKEQRFEEANQFATALLADDPGNSIAVSILVAQKVSTEDHEGALELLNKALADAPDELGFHVAKLQSLEFMRDQDAIGVQLEEMAEIFPTNPQVAKGRVQWFLNTGDTQSAITAQRELSALFPEDPVHALTVASLLNQFEGRDVARAELTRLSKSEDNRAAYVRALADFEYLQGNTDIAIAHLENLLDQDLSEDDKHDSQAQRAAMLRAQGRTEEALEVVEGILKADQNHVESLKIRALSEIDSDKPHNAISDLRTALSVQAQDPDILMLLALAHERNGSVGLAQERLALAVQAADEDPTAVLRYAEFLVRHNKSKIALAALTDALEKRGPLPSLLAGLGQVQVALSDWDGATQTVARLRSIRNDPQSAQVAQDLELAVLNGEQRFAQSIGVLREMWDVAGENTSAMENLVRSYIQTGKTDEAAKFLEDIMKEDTTNLRANLLRGALHAYLGETKEAEDRYRLVIENHPEKENGYGALASLLSAQGRTEEADEVVKTGIAEAENTERLLFSRASRLEQEQDYEGAIAIYEQLYAANKVSDVLANNLASLLSEFRDDPESLERAFNISKRLRASEQPAFQDTYGWILYKRGEYERAIQPLKAASEGAPNNIFVQYHLGMVYDKIGQKDLARTQLARALELGEGTGLPILETAQEVLDRLTSQ